MNCPKCHHLIRNGACGFCAYAPPAPATCYKVGEPVLAVSHLHKLPDGDSPGSDYCHPGDLLFIRSIGSGEFFDYFVSHQGITDRSFGVKSSEIKPCNANALPARPTEDAR